MRGTEIRGTVGEEGHRAVPCRSEGGGVARWEQEQGDGCWWGAQREQELSPGLGCAGFLVNWVSGGQLEFRRAPDWRDRQTVVIPMVFEQTVQPDGIGGEMHVERRRGLRAGLWMLCP